MQKQTTSPWIKMAGLENPSISTAQDVFWSIFTMPHQLHWVTGRWRLLSHAQNAVRWLVLFTRSSSGISSHSWLKGYAWHFAHQWLLQISELCSIKAILAMLGRFLWRDLFVYYMLYNSIFVPRPFPAPVFDHSHVCKDGGGGRTT